MDLIRERPSDVNTVRSVTAGLVVVGEHRLTASAVILPDRVISGWRPRTLAELTVHDLHAVLEHQPELVILGVGPALAFPDPAITAAANERRIGIEIMDTAAACRTYNVLVHDGRRAAAALIL